MKIALPSDGALYEPTLAFMAESGMPVERPNVRQYTAYIPAIDGVEVLFQRSADITQKVQEGSAELGIVGLDRYRESRREEGDVVPIIEDLNFGRCELVLAVPIGWLDITSMNDLAELSMDFRQRGRRLRIATKYPRLVQHYLRARDVYYFTLVQSSGSLEGAPAAGYADMIADISASGTTLRENRLKTLEDGTIMVSQASLIANRGEFRMQSGKLRRACALLEMMEAHLKATPYYRLTANVKGRSQEELIGQLQSRPDLAGLKGPTVSRVYNTQEEDWYDISLVVPKEKLLETVEHLRSCGGVDIGASQVSYLFGHGCLAYETLLKAVGGE